MKQTPIQKEIVDRLVSGLGIQDFAKATIREVKQVAAMAEKAGNSLDICTIVKDVHSKGVASTMPADVLVDAGTLHPPFNGLAAAFV